MSSSFERLHEIINEAYVENFSILSQKMVNPSLYLALHFPIGIPFKQLFLNVRNSFFFTNFTFLVEEVEVKFSVLKSITSDHIFQHLEPFQLVKMAIVVENFSLKLLENYFLKDLFV